MNFDEAKAEVMALPDEVALSVHVAKIANRLTADAGFVIWDAVIPANVPYAVHKLTFLDAVYTALGFVQGATGNVLQREWLVLGMAAHATLRSLDKFEEKPLTKCFEPLWFTGKLGRITVYIDKNLPAMEWLAGDVQFDGTLTKCCSRGEVRNYPTNFGQLITPEAQPPPRPDRVPRGAPLWRALHGAVDRRDEEAEELDENGDPVERDEVIDRHEAEVVEEEPEFQRLNDGRILL